MKRREIEEMGFVYGETFKSMEDFKNLYGIEEDNLTIEEINNWDYYKAIEENGKILIFVPNEELQQELEERWF